MSGTEDHTLPGTLPDSSDPEQETSDTEETSTPVVDPPPATTGLPSRNARGQTIRRPQPAPVPSSPPPTQTPPPPPFPHGLSATSLTYLSTPTRELFTGPLPLPEMETSTASSSGTTTTTKPSDKKGKQSTNTDQHTNASKRGFAPSYKLSSIPKLSGSQNYSTWRDISEYVLRLFNCWEPVLGAEGMPEQTRANDGDVSNEGDIDGYQDRYHTSSKPSNPNG